MPPARPHSGWAGGGENPAVTTARGRIQKTCNPPTPAPCIPSAQHLELLAVFQHNTAVDRSAWLPLPSPCPPGPKPSQHRTVSSPPSRRPLALPHPTQTTTYSTASDLPACCSLSSTTPSPPRTHVVSVSVRLRDSRTSRTHSISSPPSPNPRNQNIMPAPPKQRKVAIVGSRSVGTSL